MSIPEGTKSLMIDTANDSEERSYAMHTLCLCLCLSVSRITPPEVMDCFLCTFWASSSLDGKSQNKF